MGLDKKIHYIRGLKTGWLEGGDSLGPIMYFIHGYPDTSETFAAQFEFFKDAYHIVAPYTRGAQPSEPPLSLDRYRMESLVLDHLAILQCIDPSQSRPVILIGHDLGAAQSVALARYLGQRLKALVLLNGASMEQMLLRWQKRPEQLMKSWYMAIFLCQPVSDFILQRFPGIFLQRAYHWGGLSPDKRPRLKTALPGIIHPVNQYRAFFRQIPGLVRCKQAWPRIKAPTLVLCGASDPFLSVMQCHEMDEMACDYTIRILEGGHWLHRECEASVNEMIKDFIECLGSQK